MTSFRFRSFAALALCVCGCASKSVIPGPERTARFVAANAADESSDTRAYRDPALGVVIASTSTVRDEVVTCSSSRVIVEPYAPGWDIVTELVLDTALATLPILIFQIMKPSPGEVNWDAGDPKISPCRGNGACVNLNPGDGFLSDLGKSFALGVNVAAANGKFWCSLTPKGVDAIKRQVPPGRLYPPANGTPDVDVTKLEGFDSSWVDCGDRLKESEACTPIGVPVRSFVSRVRRSSEPAAVSCDGTPLGAKPAADSKGAWVVPAAEFDAKCGKARRLTLRVGADERSIPIDGRVRDAAR